VHFLADNRASRGASGCTALWCNQKKLIKYSEGMCNGGVTQFLGWGSLEQLQLLLADQSFY
jgi:hypothetical protein